MELLLAALLFVLVTGAVSIAGIRWWARPKAVVERVTGAAVAIEEHIPTHPSLAFRDMIRRLGSLLPASSKESGLAQRRLVRAGFRHPQAVRILLGAKLFLGGLFLLASVLGTAGWQAAADQKLIAVAVAATAGYSAPSSYVRIRSKRRVKRMQRGLPDALDLLVICVESGVGLDQAMMQAAKELEIAQPEISGEFALVNLELKAGKRRAEALRNLADRSGADDLKKLVAVLIQADRFGTSVAQSLRTHSDFMRVQARQRAEEKAAKLGVKLVFPIFFCILPTLFVVTVGPVAVRIIRELLPMMNNM